MALALISQASNGTTFEEIKNGLNLNVNNTDITDKFHEFYKSINESAGESELLIANQIYVQQGYQLKNDFKKVAADKFLTGIESVDFGKTKEMAELINNFIKQKTNQRIKSILKLKPFDKHDHLIMINAISFKCKWNYVSKKEKIMSFFLSEFEWNDVRANEILETLINYGNLTDLDAQAFEIDYTNSSFSLLIILPKNRTGLTALEARLNGYNLTKIYNQMNLTKINVQFPKFEVETEIHLNDILKNVRIECSNSSNST